MTAPQPVPSGTAQPGRTGGISRRTKWIIGAVIVLAVLGQIGSTINKPSTGSGPAAGSTFAAGSTSAAGSNTSVPWGDYNPAVQTRIDAMATKKDCAGLHTEFDTADANNVATMNRTGHNNAALMDYIDGKLREAECY